ncbi:hypothetical protein Rwratislav_22497, partial [Rhodococcus wratislaviensis IFP 2016]
RHCRTICVTIGSGTRPSEFAAQPLDDVGVGIGHRTHHLDNTSQSPPYPGPVYGKTASATRARNAVTVPVHPGRIHQERG